MVHPKTSKFRPAFMYLCLMFVYGKPNSHYSYYIIPGENITPHLSSCIVYVGPRIKLQGMSKNYSLLGTTKN